MGILLGIHANECTSYMECIKQRSRVKITDVKLSRCRFLKQEQLKIQIQRKNLKKVFKFFFLNSHR